MVSYKLLFILFLTLGIGIPVLIFTVANYGGRGYTFKARSNNDTSYLARYYLVDYRSVEEIYDYIDNLVSNYTFFCHLKTIGNTTRKGKLPGYPIKVINVNSGFSKPKILIVSGIYANDWMSVTSVLFVINQLLCNCSASGTLITSYDWYFVPIMNPDGYSYSKTTPIGLHWIKNMARWSMDATGVNLNRNFKDHFKLNYNYYGNNFPGFKSFSEEESKILRDFVYSIKDDIKLAIILRSYTYSAKINRNSVTYPWSHSAFRVKRWYSLQYLATLGVEAINANTGSNYIVQQSGVYEANQSGTIDDWLYGGCNINKVFSIVRNYRADYSTDTFEYINKCGTEVFSIIRRISLNLFVHPNDYHKQK